jgi:phenylacetic acid degradation operon negative regulatory protein
MPPGAAARPSGATGPALSRRHNISAPSARSLLLTVLGELVLPAGRPVWTSALLQVLGGLGVEEKSARQAIARTAADGWISPHRTGRQVRWVLTAPGRRLLTEGAERIYSFGTQPAPWDGRWLIVLASVPETQRTLRHRMQTRLAWAGFGNPAAGVWVSPHPEREAEVKQVIEELGRDLGALSFTGPFASIGAERDLVRRAWDLDRIAGHYQAFLDEFGRLRPRPGDPMLLAQIRLVHEWRRFPFLDPGLPGELLPPRWIGHRARALFDRLHTAWRDDVTAWWARRTDDG